MALDHPLAVCVVVVGELLACLDVPSSANPDVLADNLAVAVRLARVVDESRDVSADHRVPDPAPVDREAPDFTALQVVGLTLEAFLVIDQFALVGDDARVLVDRLEREHAPAMDLGTPANDARQLRLMGHA